MKYQYSTIRAAIRGRILEARRMSDATLAEAIALLSSPECNTCGLAALGNCYELRFFRRERRKRLSEIQRTGSGAK